MPPVLLWPADSSGVVGDVAADVARARARLRKSEPELRIALADRCYEG